jgi:hypothetical protein
MVRAYALPKNEELFQLFALLYPMLLGLFSSPFIQSLSVCYSFKSKAVCLLLSSFLVCLEETLAQKMRTLKFSKLTLCVGQLQRTFIKIIFYLRAQYKIRRAFLLTITRLNALASCEPCNKITKIACGTNVTL